MEQRDAVIEYRAKVRQLHEANDSHSPYIEFKKIIGRRDCNLRPQDHTYYNSDMFPSMLQRAYDKAIGNDATLGAKWCRLSKLPACVSIDTSGFLATVRVSIKV